MAHWRGATDGETDADCVGLGVGVALWSVRRRTTLLLMSFTSHQPAPSATTVGLLSSADVASPPPPATPAAVAKTPAADTYRMMLLPCSLTKRPPPGSYATVTGARMSAPGCVAALPSPPMPALPHVPAAFQMTPAALT